MREEGKIGGCSWWLWGLGWEGITCEDAEGGEGWDVKGRIEIAKEERVWREGNEREVFGNRSSGRVRVRERLKREC